MTATTSRTRPGKPKAPRSGDRRRFPNGQGRGTGGPRAAFTLLELTLVLSMIAVLTVVVALSVWGWRKDVAFEEGVSRFESALRLARTEAAHLGLRLRLAFDANGGITVLYEPKPLEAPEEFVEYVGCTWRSVLDGCAVRVSRCELTGSSAYQPVGRNQFALARDGEAPMDSLTFYPDGSSDPALVELSPPDDADTRRAVIQVAGMDGGISTWMVVEDYLADTYDQIRREEYPYDTEGG